MTLPRTSDAHLPDSGGFAEARRRMVARDLAGRGIADRRVLDAMGRVPRELFVPAPLRADAYADNPLAIGRRQTISQPYVVALMTEWLDVAPGRRVLELGTGSGYQTAVLAALGAEVFTIERHEELSLAAEDALDAAGYGEKVTLRVDDGTLGWPEEAPFDRILVTAAGPQVPPSLQAQLADGGGLVMPLAADGRQRLVRLTRRSAELVRENGLDVRFVPLVGAEGYADERLRD